MQTHILGLVTPLMALFFAATFWALWRAGRMKRYVLGFALAYVLFPIGYLATHLLPTEAFYVWHLTQMLYVLATVTMLGAVCERAGQRTPYIGMGVVYAISAISLGIAIAVSDDAAPRLLIVNIGYGVMTAMVVMTLLGAQRREWIDKAIIAVAAFSAADFLVRPVMSLLIEESIPAAVYRDSVYYSLIGLMLGVKTMLTAMVLIGATVLDLTDTMRETSERDPLTGLHNRGAFETEMQCLTERAYSEGRPLCLVIADIDNFKQVNDIWGHQAGDQAIASFGGLIEHMVRGCDVAGRVGGEEFCIAVWNCPLEPAQRLAERIRHAFAQIEIEGLNTDIRLTASFGVAIADKGETYESLFSRADAALYRAKSSGRNRVEASTQDGVRDTRDPLPQKAALHTVDFADAPGHRQAG